ncbi:YCF48-related protein [Ignavibacterium sp.]|uniref:YCF48-related protein n=1 Tax=Ignavibacterium sp. TaxID=2651167 RepID=UPI00220D466D|nr:YCF48-related protein [Ignavibacterium sp.]BDQ04002.1 MAG: hypothetical protein KatS3mg037_2577 [Ignavibacterium sp.]
MKIYCLFSTFLLLLNSISYPQWQWISPIPTGNDLLCTHFFTEDTGFIYSSKGEIFKTTDGGANWNLVEKNLEKAAVINIKYLNQNTGYMLTREKLFKTTDRGNSWFELNTSNHSGFNGIYFLDIGNFWIVGDSGLIIHSTNDGLNWSNHSLNTGYKNTTIYFLNDSLGFIGREFYTSLKTTNAGLTWSTVQTSGHMLITKYFFLNSDTGFAIGRQGKIFRTTNKGQDWQNVSPFNTYKFIDAYLTTDSILVLFSNTGEIAKSSDYGNSWIAHSLGNFISDFFSYVDFVNDSIFYIVGINGNIYKTNDAGNSWQKLRKGLEISIHDISFINKDSGWILSSVGEIFKTTDGGSNWIRQISDSSYLALNKLFIVDENIGYAVGQKILKTTNSGNDWTNIYEDGKIYYTCFFLDSAKGLVAGQYGKILITTNGGNNFITINDSGGSPLVSMFFVNENVGFIGGLGTLLKTTDGGFNWINIQVSDNYINGIFFWDASNGCIVSMDKIYKTNDGGHTWVNTYTDSISDWFMDIEFMDEQVGIAVSTGGNILTSNDGGTSWIANKYVTNNLSAMCSSQDSLVWICGPGGKILFSTINQITSVEKDSINYNLSSYKLFQNYPNPFNPRTTITYEINTAGFVKLIIYDLLGREIKTLINEEKMPGKHSIDFISDNLSSGVYFYQLRFNNYIENRKMMLLK